MRSMMLVSQIEQCRVQAYNAFWAISAPSTGFVLNSISHARGGTLPCHKVGRSATTVPRVCSSHALSVSE